MGQKWLMDEGLGILGIRTIKVLFTSFNNLLERKKKKEKKNE
jgi:hypothetical protein